MMISSYHNKESMMMMNSSPLLSPLPPSQIECSLSCRIANDESAPQSPMPSFIVDYGMFRAEEEKERDERHLLALLREQQQRHKQQQSRRDSYTRAIVVPCGNHDDNSSEGSNSSEVMFALKVSKPSRLVPRRSRNLSSSRSSIRGGLRGWGNQSMMTDNKQSNQRTFNGMMMTSDMSLMKLLEESMIFHQSPAEEEEKVEEPMQDNDDLLLDELLRDDLPSPPPMGDFSQTNHNLSNSSNMNHDSFQSTEEEGEQQPTDLSVDPLLQRRNKRRRIMMNWLANQEASRNLLVADGSSSSSSTSDSPFVPPTFVKVIYCNEATNTTTRSKEWNSNNADPTAPTPSTIISLDQSHHNNVASPMA